MASTENGASPSLSLAIWIWCSRAKSRSSVAALEGPLAPWRHDPDRRLQCVVAELEAHLVVALAGGAVRHRVGADFPGDLDLFLGDQRPGDRGAEQVDALVEGIGPKHREYVVADKLLAQVLDEDVALLDAQHLRLAPGRLQLLALAEVGGERHHLGLIGLLQPLQDDRRVEPSRIGEHDLLHPGPDTLGGHRLPLAGHEDLRRTIGEIGASASARPRRAARVCRGGLAPRCETRECGYYLASDRWREATDPVNGRDRLLQPQ